jgi:hypothetical protein
MRPLALVIGLTLLFASSAAGQATAILADGQHLEARLAGIDAEGKISLALADAIRVVPAADLVLLGSYRDAERGPQILLGDGSLIKADVLDIGRQQVTIGDATGLGRMLWEVSHLPRSAVRAIVYQPPADPIVRDKLLLSLRDSEPREDEIHLLGGEVIRGTLVSEGSDRAGPQPAAVEQDSLKLAIAGRDEPLAVSLAKVQALALAGARRTDSRDGEDVPLILGMTDGSLVRVRQVKLGRGAVHLALTAGGELTALVETGDDAAPTFWDRVTLVQPLTPRTVYLSDLETIGYKHIPFTSVPWPYGRAQNVLGGALRSGGAIYLKGLGMHSASRLAYDLPAQFRRLEAEVALDDAAAAEGSVIFKVVLERSGQWQAAYESPVIRAGDAPQPISIPLAGASRVALLVEYADRGDVGDHANWLNVRLVK